MSKHLKIQIPTPCHQNWNEMNSVGKGRFCDSCEKTVIDFTSASDRQIIVAVRSDANLCGRLNANQVNRVLITPKEKKTIWIAAASSVLSFLSSVNNNAIAQNKPITEQDSTESFYLGKVAPQTNLHAVSGTVFDEENNPYSGVKIWVDESERNTTTSAEGKFSIRAKQGDILVFLKDGKEEEFVISDYLNNIEIRFKTRVPISVIAGGIRAIDCKKPTFFGRIFHSIGNWFR